MRPILLAAALAGLLAGTAEARTPRRGHPGLAVRQARIDALAPPEDPADAVGIAAAEPAPAQTGELPPAFALDLLLPLVRNSDPQQAARGTPSLELTPEARLGWSRRLEASPLRLSALLDASTDRFARAHEADADVLYGRLRGQYESGADDQEWQGFASYVETRSFTPTFARQTEAWHDIGLGLSKMLAFDGHGRVAAAADTEAASLWQVAVNATVQRRLRQPAPGSVALLVNPALTWTPSPRWTMSLEVDAALRRYDRAEGTRRRDLLATPVLTLEYLPPEGWLPAGAVLDLQVFFSRQYSSAVEGRFRQSGAGPVLRSAWKF